MRPCFIAFWQKINSRYVIFCFKILIVLNRNFGSSEFSTLFSTVFNTLLYFLQYRTSQYNSLEEDLIAPNFFFYHKTICLSSQCLV